LSVQKQVRKTETKLKKIEELIKTAEDCLRMFYRVRDLLGRFGVLHPQLGNDIMSIALLIAGKGRVRKRGVLPEVMDELKLCLDVIDTLNEIYSRMHKGGYSELLEVVSARRQEELEEEEELAEEEADEIIEKFKQKRGLGLS